MESCEDSCHLRSLGECRSMRCWLAQHWDFRTTCQDFFGVYGAILGRDLSGITTWFCVWGDYVTKSRSLFLVASGPDEAEDWQLVNRRDELEVPAAAFPAFNWGLARAGMELTLMTLFDVPMLLLTPAGMTTSPPSRTRVTPWANQGRPRSHRTSRGPTDRASLSGPVWL